MFFLANFFIISLSKIEVAMFGFGIQGTINKDFFFRWLVEIRMHFCNISMTKGTQQKISARTSIFRFLASTTESTLTEAVDLFPINGSSRVTEKSNRCTPRYTAFSGILS
jgi:hypothetical protein